MIHRPTWHAVLLYLPKGVGSSHQVGLGLITASLQSAPQHRSDIDSQRARQIHTHAHAHSHTHILTVYTHTPPCTLITHVALTPLTHTHTHIPLSHTYTTLTHLNTLSHSYTTRATHSNSQHIYTCTHFPHPHCAMYVVNKCSETWGGINKIAYSNRTVSASVSRRAWQKERFVLQMSTRGDCELSLCLRQWYSKTYDKSQNENSPVPPPLGLL